jgi:hypothetical protein
MFLSRPADFCFLSQPLYVFKPPASDLQFPTSSLQFKSESAFHLAEIRFNPFGKQIAIFRLPSVGIRFPVPDLRLPAFGLSHARARLCSKLCMTATWQQNSGDKRHALPMPRRSTTTRAQTSLLSDALTRAYLYHGQAAPMLLVPFITLTS